MSVTQISAKDAFNLLKNDQSSILIDVRTFEEFKFVGITDSAEFSDRMALIPWQLFPEMQVNPEFGEKLEDYLRKLFGNAIEEIKIVFLCRTGGRSNAAANHATNLGYKNCYNLVSGFEGDLNQYSQRGKVNGWKAENLPWRQN
ncbi:MAG: rhodanese-like domain-containing protein [Rickettsiales bacterium]|nr:rhodanese-like domain-containing protein [Rickettsiales bacterium]